MNSQSRQRLDGLVMPLQSAYPGWLGEESQSQEMIRGLVPPSDNFFKQQVLSILRGININTYNTAINPGGMKPPGGNSSSASLVFPDDGKNGEYISKGGRRKTRRHKKTRRHR